MRPLLCFLSILFVAKTTFAEIPAEITKCKAGDTVCMAKTATEIIQKYPQGNKVLGLRELEPLRVDKVVVNEGNEGALSLKLSMKDVLIFGISKAAVISTTGFTAEPDKFELVITVPTAKIKAVYNVDGRILVLPIQGEGDVNLTFDNLKVSVKIKPEVIKKDGLTYLKSNINKIKVLVEPEGLTMKFDNLFNGDKALGDHMNIFLNENWKDVWGELSGAVSSVLATILDSLFNDVFEKLPYEEWYKKE